MTKIVRIFYPRWNKRYRNYLRRVGTELEVDEVSDRKMFQEDMKYLKPCAECKGETSK